MSVLRTVVLSALGGSILHVSLRLASAAPVSRARRPGTPPPVTPVPLAEAEISTAEILALVAATRQTLGTLPRSEQTGSIPATAAARIERLSSRLAGDFRNLDRCAIETSSRLLESELDVRLTALEQVLSHQTHHLRSLRELTARHEFIVSRLTGELETLCNILASTSPALPTTVSNPEADRVEMPGLASESAHVGPHPMKAMFALGPVQTEAERRIHGEEFVSKVHCAKCFSLNTRRAYRLNWIDECLRLFSFNPWRCRGCGARFYHIILAVSVKLEESRESGWRAATGRLARLLRPAKPPQSEDLAH